MMYPKLLIVSRLNWDDDSNSNSLTNFFDGYDPDKIARIYIETKKPNTKCCHHFFQISEVALILRLFKWKTKTGRKIDTGEGYSPQVNQEANEESLMSFARHHRSFFLTICRDILWNFGGWKTPELKQFILDFNPDVVWLDGSPLILMNKLNNYVAEIAGKPTCTFLMDDAYTYKSCTSLSSRIYRFFIRKHIRKTIVNSRHVFVSSEKMKHEFDSIFSINSTFLAKGVTEFKDCAQLPLATPPFKIVYLGNVLIGRFDSLVLLAEAIHRINTEQGKKYELSVYTGDYISDAKKRRFLLDDSIRLCKPVPYYEVPSIINANDMVVFVESLEGKQTRIARLSFSTKIVDYIISGKCILTIGPVDISPVEYLKDYGISLAACSKDEIYSVLKSLTPEKMHEYVLKADAFARQNHDKNKIQANLYNIIREVANKNKLMNKKLCAIATIEGTMNSFIIPAMEYFVDKGYNVTLICTMSDDFIKKNSGKFHCVNIPMKRGIAIGDMLRLPWTFWRLFRKEKFDYIQYATTNASFYACIPAKFCGIKTRVYCQWGLLYVGYTGIKRRIFKLVEKFLCSSATHITVASKKNLDYAVEEGLMPASKATVIGDGGTVGVELSVFDIAKREAFKAQVLEEHPELKGRLVYGYVGRIETDKGISELLEAFTSLDNDHYALLLIGPFDELRNDINPDLIERAKATRRVVFHGFTKEVPKYMSAMDILVHPTYREGFSMVIQQAMAMECAIITTNVPGPSEVIEEGVSGLLVPDHSAKDLANAMNQLADDKALRTSFAKAGLERVRKLFNRQRMLELTYQDRLRMMNDYNK